MTVNTYLSYLASSLVLSDLEKSSIETSISTIKTRLNSYFADIYDKKVFGSYVRHTILPRKADSESDIDIMIVFNNPYGHKPQSFLNRLKSFAEHYYQRSEIYQSSPTIVLELNHIKFELTPACIYYGTYYIPNGPSEWIPTDPDGFYRKLTQCNVNNGSKIKPVVRLLKHWNIQKNSRDLASFALEKKIAEGMMYACYNYSTYTDYLCQAFELIKSDTDSSKVNTALLHIATALRYERAQLNDWAIAEIKKVFPEV